MPKPDLTLCVNLAARQADTGLIERILEVLDSSSLRYNQVDIKNLEHTPEQTLGRILVAVGGDGTVNSVASAAIEYDRRLGVIPLGTFNHFAKDIGLPLDIPGAVNVILAGQVKRVDVGNVRGKIFLNNSAVGFYPNLVAKKERYQQTFGKWIALAISTAKILSKLQSYHFKLVLDGRVINIRTTLMMVSNNKYDLTNVGIASRRRLDEGELYVYAIKQRNIFKMAAVSFKLLLGKVGRADFVLYQANQLQVFSKKRRLRVSLDGESWLLQTPLNYKITPKSLEVIC